MTIYELCWGAGGVIPETKRYFQAHKSPDHLTRFAEVVVMMDRDPAISAAYAHLKQLDGDNVTWIAGWTKVSDERPTTAGFDTLEKAQKWPPTLMLFQPGDETEIDRVWTDARWWRSLGAVVGGEVGKLRAALARLASGLAFGETPRVATDEERMRMQFAQAELDASRDRYSPAILIDMHAAKEMQIGLLTAEVEDLREDAERWRALLTIPEIKMQGSAGVNPHTGERTSDHVHFGAEFWSDMDIEKYPDLTEGRVNSTAWGRHCLIATADRLREKAQRQEAEVAAQA